MRPRVLNLEPDGYCEQAREILESFADYFEGPVDTADIRARIGEVDAIIVRLGHRISGEVIIGAPNLRVIASATTGRDHIDLDTARDCGVIVISLHGERDFLDTIHATAEHTWALILTLARHIPEASRHVQQGGWDRQRFVGTELDGKTLGVVGCGRLGTIVARYGQAFGMTVIACDPAPLRRPEGVEFLELETLLGRADVVTLHVPLNDKTEGLFGSLQFRSMRTGAWLINTSRGNIVETAALLEVLENGRIAAALDVLPGEDAGDPSWSERHPLIKHAKSQQNLIITPHIGGATQEAMARTEVFIANKLLNFLTTSNPKFLQ